MADQELVQQSSNERYFVRSSGRVLGPFDLAKLKNLRSRGRLSRADEFSTDRQTWEPLASLDALASPVDDTRRQRPLQLEAESEEPEFGPQAAWFYFSGGEQQGPVTSTALRSLIARGAVQPDDLVWKEGMSDWAPTEEVPELSPPPRMPAGPGLSISTRSEERAGTSVVERTSGMAVTSLILAILSSFVPIMLIVMILVVAFFPANPAPVIAVIGSLGLLSIIAICFAAVALSSIGASRGELRSKRLAVSGLIVGIVSAMLWLVLVLSWSHWTSMISDLNSL